MGETEETSPPEMVETVEESLAETVAPGSVTTPLEPVMAKIDEVADRIIARLDAVTQTQSPRDEHPAGKPWTHRKPFRHGDDE
ncbi:MAG TPA: hypothetical protein VJ553_02065 [Candidatus Paceibacterota bacterium]|nr:hypothetical protein [Candidatus Paceibacterota bacterium]